MVSTTTSSSIQRQTNAIHLTPSLSRLERFAGQIASLESIPGLDAILQPLLSYLQQPFEKQDMQRIVDLISHDNALTAQCLHMANSPLLGHWQPITTPRAAVAALGLQRMRDIVLSCCMLRLLSEDSDRHELIALWEHSLACALISRKLARRVGVPDPEQAYIAGLLHDLGLMVNLHLAPGDFRERLRRARAECCSLHVLEHEAWGCTHCDTGAMLAARWELAPLVIDVVQQHHQPPGNAPHRATIALITIGDQLCRANGLGYGWVENLRIDWEQNELLELLKEEWPVARNLNWPAVGAELASYLKEVRKLVAVMFRFQ
ncbi:MAG TPA: HDOD domain-containing protein [Terriglobales bacterium]|nr:HDOD domain-containing protein [Terriglobales bacterium]